MWGQSTEDKSIAQLQFELFPIERLENEFATILNNLHERQRLLHKAEEEGSTEAAKYYDEGVAHCHDLLRRAYSRALAHVERKNNVTGTN
jgi:hypothetical protein